MLPLGESEWRALILLSLRNSLPWATGWGKSESTRSTWSLTLSREHSQKFDFTGTVGKLWVKPVLIRYGFPYGCFHLIPCLQFSVMLVFFWFSGTCTPCCLLCSNIHLHPGSVKWAVPALSLPSPPIRSAWPQLSTAQLLLQSLGKKSTFWGERFVWVTKVLVKGKLLAVLLTFSWFHKYLSCINSKERLLALNS